MTAPGDLAARFGLSAETGDRLDRLLDLLERDPAAPTTVTARADAVDVHLADSLSALELAPVREARAMADVGSGAGLPGLPLAAALPSTRVHLVESAGRRCDFLARAVATMGLDNAEVVRARVEQWGAGRDTCDVVVARALAPLAVVAEYAAPLLAMGGTLVAWRGARSLAEEEEAAAAGRVLGLREQEILAVTPYAGSRARHLHTFTKVAPTAERFPRRPGLARKRPLGARSEGLT